MFLDMEDFTFIFDLVEKYKPLVYKLIPDEVAKNPEFITFVKNLGKNADNSEAIYRGIIEEERALEKEDIVGKSALQHLIEFNETMVEIIELEDWVEQHAYVKKRLEDNHDSDCGCDICTDFNRFWQDMADIVNAYHKKEAYRKFVEEYEVSDRDMKSLAKLFLKNYSLIISLRIPEVIKDVSPGIVSYKEYYNGYERFCFVFADEPWNQIYKDLPLFTGLMNAMYFHLLDKFNAANKSFYLQYDFKKMYQYFGDTLIDKAAFFFDVHYEIVVKFPHILTPEGKFVD